jgi:ribosomal protein RSM22 (predicted rRNA methylase)
MDAKVHNFTIIESIYGRFVINRHCQFQAESLIKTGHPHIQDELNKILTIVGSLPGNCVVVDAGANAGFVRIPIAKEILGRAARSTPSKCSG